MLLSLYWIQRKESTCSYKKIYAALAIVYPYWAIAAIRIQKTPGRNPPAATKNPYSSLGSHWLFAKAEEVNYLYTSYTHGVEFCTKTVENLQNNLQSPSSFCNLVMHTWFLCAEEQHKQQQCCSHWLHSRRLSLTARSHNLSTIHSTAKLLRWCWGL